MSHENDLRLLTTADSEVEALMWKEQLENAGIRVLVRPGGPGAGAWASAATFAHEIFVRADQAGMARALLNDNRETTPLAIRARRGAPRVNRAARTNRLR